MPAPHPGQIREMNLSDVADLGYPLPPPNFPLVWSESDEVELRSRLDLEIRCVILHVLLTAALGAPRETTLGWLERNDIADQLTDDERMFLEQRSGNIDEFMLCIEAEWALAWLLGIADELDPTQYVGDGLAAWAPNLREDEPFEAWRLRSPVQIRSAEEASVLLDLYYCLDAGNAEAMRKDAFPPGVTQPYVIGQRRWALEWAVIFRGEYHGDPPAWDEVEMGV